MSDLRIYFIFDNLKIFNEPSRRKPVMKNILHTSTNILNMVPSSKLTISTRSAKCKMAQSINLYRVMVYFNEMILKQIPNYQIVGIIYVNKDNNVVIMSGQYKQSKHKKRHKEPVKNEKEFRNQATINIKTHPDRNPVSVKLFVNESISMVGCKSAPDADINIIEENTRDAIAATTILQNEIKQIEGVFETELLRANFNITNHYITMINSQFNLFFKINSIQLYNIISEQYSNYVEYTPQTHPGVRIRFHWNKQYREDNNITSADDLIKDDGLCYCNNKDNKKCNGKGNGLEYGKCNNATIIVFNTGKVNITGGIHALQCQDARMFMIKIAQKHYNEIYRYDIRDNTKKQKTIKIKLNLPIKKISDYIY
jgi:TATA-box binding protein (TBP) (component of TFIID and TFIIIB)